MSEARDRIEESDLLLYRRRGLIAIAGRGEYSHAAKAAWRGDDLFCLEVRELCGGRAVTLASQARRHSGKIDVYQTNPDNRWPHYDRAGATRFMRRLAGCDYGWANLWAAALLHLPWIRLWVRANTNDGAIDRRPPFCSQAVAMADRLTELNDLARSPFYRYRFTLLE
jgi:hypothetical protein